MIGCPGNRALKVHIELASLPGRARLGNDASIEQPTHVIIVKIMC